MRFSTSSRRLSSSLECEPMIRKFPYVIRVVRARGELPYPVEIVLPRGDGVRSGEPRDPNRFYIEDALPDTETHHTILGAYIAQWGQVEVNVGSLFAALAAIQPDICSCVLSSMGTKQISDAVVSLASLRLPAQNLEEVVNLTERLSKATRCRNQLVHGHWVAEMVIWPYKGDILAKFQMLRCSTPADKTVEAKLINPKNQKERTKYFYTEKRILGSIADAAKLAADIARFTDRVGDMLKQAPSAPA